MVCVRLFVYAEFRPTCMWRPLGRHSVRERCGVVNRDRHQAGLNALGHTRQDFTGPHSIIFVTPLADKL